MKHLIELTGNITTKFSLAITVIFTLMTAVTWFAASETIKLVAPIMVWTMTVLTVMLVLFAAVLSTEWFRLKRSQMRRDRTFADNEAKMSTIQTNDAQLQLEFEGRTKAAIVQQVERGMVLGTGHLSDMELVKLPVNTATPLLEAGQTEDEIKPLIPLIKEKERVMIYGPPDAGKTTLLRHIVDAKLELGTVLAIDPHGNTPKWGHVSHIGQGRDFRGIGIMLGQIVNEITKRYDAEKNHPETIGKHPYVTVVIDELRAIINNCKAAGEDLATIICEGRKANVHIVFVAHSKNVKGLGIQGEGDIRSGISQVTLYGNKDTERKATHHIIGFDEPIPVALPGPYPDNVFNQQVNQVKPDFVDVATDGQASIFGLDVAENSEDMIDQQVIKCYQETGSYSKAFRLLYELENGEAYTKAIGGNQTAKVKAILDRHNIAHPIK